MRKNEIEKHLVKFMDFNLITIVVRRGKSWTECINFNDRFSVNLSQSLTQLVWHFEMSIVLDLDCLGVGIIPHNFWRMAGDLFISIDQWDWLFCTCGIFVWGLGWKADFTLERETQLAQTCRCVLSISLPKSYGRIKKRMEHKEES